MVLNDDKSTNMNISVNDEEYTNELNVCKRCVSMNINKDDEARLIIVNKLLASMVHRDLVVIANEYNGPCVAFKDGKFGKANVASPEIEHVDEFVTKSEVEKMIKDAMQSTV